MTSTCYWCSLPVPLLRCDGPECRLGLCSACIAYHLEETGWVSASPDLHCLECHRAMATGWRRLCSDFVLAASLDRAEAVKPLVPILPPSVLLAALDAALEAKSANVIDILADSGQIPNSDLHSRWLNVNVTDSTTDRISKALRK